MCFNDDFLFDEMEYFFWKLIGIVEYYEGSKREIK